MRSATRSDIRVTADRRKSWGLIIRTDPSFTMIITMISMMMMIIMIMMILIKNMMIIVIMTINLFLSNIRNKVVF